MKAGLMAETGPIGNGQPAETVAISGEIRNETGRRLGPAGFESAF